MGLKEARTRSDEGAMNAKRYLFLSMLATVAGLSLSILYVFGV